MAGALGALLRYLVDQLVQRRAGSDFPLGILVVNLSGSFVLGVLVGVGAHHGLSAPWVTVLGTGLIGAYTTFSTFTFDTVRLAERRPVVPLGPQRGPRHRRRHRGGGGGPGPRGGDLSRTGRAPDVPAPHNVHGTITPLYPSGRLAFTSIL